MPLQREHLQFAVLFLCVPIQYLAVEFMGSSEVSRTYAISQLVDELYKLRSQWLAIEPWRKWCIKVLDTITEHGLRGGGPWADFDSHDALGESPAIEVMKFREKNGYFAQGPEKRDPKPPSVIYRVGQVVSHKKWKYHGVIIGWDVKAKAPPEWLKEMHGEANKHWREQPNYAVLVDTRDRTAPQMTYVPQENIQVIRNKKVLHPNVDDYFEAHDGAQYLPRPWLRALYPRD